MKKPAKLKLPKVVYMHVLDNTEGVPANTPWIHFSTSRSNPFGVPGEDYSESYPWTRIKFVPAEVAAHPEAKEGKA